MWQSSHLAVTGALRNLIQVRQQGLLLLLEQLLPVGIEVRPDGLVVKRSHVNPANLHQRRQIGPSEGLVAGTRYTCIIRRQTNLAGEIVEAVQGCVSLNSHVQSTILQANSLHLLENPSL
jgi:hypothetical protein